MSPQSRRLTDDDFLSVVDDTTDDDVVLNLYADLFTTGYGCVSSMEDLSKAFNLSSSFMDLDGVADDLDTDDAGLCSYQICLNLSSSNLTGVNADDLGDYISALAAGGPTLVEECDVELADVVYSYVGAALFLAATLAVSILFICSRFVPIRFLCPKPPLPD